MTVIRDEAPGEARAREHFLDLAYGVERFEKPSQALRCGREPAFALVAEDTHGDLVGSVRLWHVADSNALPLLLLGPLAVADHARSEGLGARLMRQALNKAGMSGHRGVILVGDAAYYARFGFEHAPASALTIRGLADPSRLLGLALCPRGLDGASGVLHATGRPTVYGDVSRALHVHTSGRLER